MRRGGFGGFETAESVEDAFYAALRKGDLTALMEIWADDDDVVCIHPGGDRIEGLDAVRASWERILSAGGMVAIGEELTGDARQRILDFSRPGAALYLGGMGARDKNFYNTICQKYGYVAEATEIQDLYLDGKKDEAAAAVPAEMLERTNLVGPAGYVKERLAAYKEAGVTHLSVNAVGGDPVRTIEQLRSML